MKRIIVAILICLPLTGMAQSEWERPLSAQEKLEQAKQAEIAAKKAVKEAQKAAKQAQKEAKRTAKQAQKEAQQAQKAAESQKAAARKAAQEAQKPVITTTDDNSGWSLPQAETKQETVQPKQDQVLIQAATPAVVPSKYAKYLEGAVPVVDGDVTFTLDLDVPGKTAQQIYDTTFKLMEQMTTDDHQRGNGSAIAIVNKQEHIIAAQYKEWLVFNNNFISLDRTQFNYTMIATCTDGHLKLTISRMNYLYDEGRSNELKVSADEWITDKYALNKKKTKMLPLSGKFRRKTIDRKDEIFKNITETLVGKQNG